MDITLFHFIRPSWLFALIPLLIMTSLVLKPKLQRGSWVKVCDEALLPYILEQKNAKTGRTSLISTTVIASFLAIIALAGPTWSRVPSPAFRNDFGLVIVLDLSRSMEAGDIKPSRYMRARYKIEDILKQRKDGQTALLVYAGSAFVVTPLTSDNATIASQLEALSPDIMPSAGSNAALAVQKAVELFKQAGLQKGEVLLITDGVDAEAATAVIDSLGAYQLSVLGVGTEEGAPIGLAEGGFLKDGAGAIVIPKLPIVELKQLAEDGHGIFQQISDTDTDIKALLATVDKSVQKAGDNSANDRLLQRWDEKGVWLVLLILPFAALSFRRGLLSFAFLLVLPLPKNSYALEWQDLWQTKDQQAYQAYNHGDYERAAQLFEDPAWKAAALYKAKQENVEQLKPAQTAIGFYNQGNVFAQAGLLATENNVKREKFNHAITAYDQALKLEPTGSLAEDAKENKKKVEEELKKLQQNQKDNKNNQQENSNKNNKEDKNNKDKKDGQNKDEKGQQNKNNQKKTDEAKDAKVNKSEHKSASETPQQKQQDQQAAEAKKPQPEKPEQNQQAQAKENEKKEADQQWLNRIPDDPAGLLRRKFKYQYKELHQQADDNNQAW